MDDRQEDMSLREKHFEISTNSVNSALGVSVVLYTNGLVTSAFAVVCNIKRDRSGVACIFWEVLKRKGNNST